jgi:hypothetical protein
MLLSALIPCCVVPPVKLFGIPARYANATYTAASKQGVLEQVETELSAFKKVRIGAYSRCILISLLNQSLGSACTLPRSVGYSWFTRVMTCPQCLQIEIAVLVGRRSFFACVPMAAV